MSNLKNYFWNIIFSILSAAQSMIMLIFVKRLIGMEEAGVFSYSFSVAVLFMHIGNYGLRNFQVSDVNERFSFAQYVSFRVISCSLMIFIQIIYLSISRWDLIKICAIVLLTGMRLVECLEDVIHGLYQQKNKLYIGCFQGTIRILISNIMFVVALFLTRSLIIGLVVYFIGNLCCFIFQTMFTIGKFGGIHFDYNLIGIRSLLIEGFPLFCGYFCSTYLNNVAKYGINKMNDDVMQAYFNIIYTPVLIINLLSTMVFRPQIVELSVLWNEKNFKRFKKNVIRQVIVIVILSLIIIPLGYFVGIPIMEVFFNVKLKNYRLEFLILLFAGAISAVSSFFNVCIILQRRQKTMLIFNTFLSVIAFILSNIIFIGNIIMIATMFYTLLMIIQAVGYFFIEWKE